MVLNEIGVFDEILNFKNILKNICDKKLTSIKDKITKRCLSNYKKGNEKKYQHIVDWKFIKNKRQKKKFV